ncbi:MAG: hypothetical protein AAF889_13320 [Cyanobacteria bacterium P01_D01_bin.73]
MAFPRSINARTLIRSLVIGAAINVVASTAIAPVANAVKLCEPPEAGRYLLMVRRDSPDVEVALYEGLPESVDVTLCEYQDETVLRLSGFPSQAIAEAWQAYISERLNRTAFLIESSSAAAGPGTSYSPQALGDGYAVLVDYFSDLAIARTLQERLGETPGLVSYGQRPYLLVSHTKKVKQANKLLEELSQAGFAVTVVNSRHAILLRSAIALPQ